MESHIFVFIVYLTGAAAQDQTFFEIVPEAKVANVVSSFKDTSLIECGRNCMENADCELAGYNKISRVCQISSHTETISDPDFVILKPTKVCGNPQSPANGQMEVIDSGKIVRFSCDTGYNLVGSRTLHCMKSSWNETVPYCDPADCGVPSLPVNGVRFNYIGTSLNDMATLVCMASYVPRIENVTCKADGTWEDTRCVLDCGTSLEIDYTNTNAIYPHGSLEGSTGYVTCARGFRSDSGKTSWNFTCDVVDQAWKSSTAPDCIWELMFRGTAGNGYNVTNAFLFGNAADGVISEEGCMDVYNASCSLNYRNTKVDAWASLNIVEVSYDLYNSTDNVLSVQFNGVGSTINSWFSTSTVIQHPWIIPDLGITWWDLNGPSDIAYGRSFRMTDGYRMNAVDCDDHYYTVVFFPPGWTCSYDDFTSYPTFTYSQALGGSIYSTEPFYTAQTIGIWVKYS